MIKDFKFEESVQTIVDLGEEMRAIKCLLDCLERKQERIEKDNSEMSACIRAIKKINKSENLAIDALCERS